MVATVADQQIAPSTVAAIARQQGISPEEALDRAVVDGLFAAAARSQLPEREVASIETRVMARALLRAMWLEAEKEPITAHELAEATEVRWTRYDRPLGYRTVHYVVEADAKADADRHARAKELAAALRKVVEPIAQRAQREPAPALDEEKMFRNQVEHPDPLVKAWEDAVKAAEQEGLSVIAQPLPPITDTGRPMEHDAPLVVNLFDADYTKQVAALRQRGEMTGVFKSYAGYHVAMLLEITPEKRVPADERREALREEILKVRGIRRRRALLERLSSQTSVDIPANVNAHLSQLEIQLDEG
jgi:hypothetical protein